AGPEARLWLMWDRNGKVYATRTNHAATKIEPVSALKPPGSGSVYELDGEGSAGPLDLIANDGQGLWHQQVRPRLGLTAASRKTGRGRVITFRVVDAGDPVGGATVKVGNRSLKTHATGFATFRQSRAAPVKASAAKRAGIVVIVKSSVSTSGSSSQVTGAETAASFRARTEYAEATVRSRAFWLKSMKTLRPRSSFHHAVVTFFGSRRSTSRANAR